MSKTVEQTRREIFEAWAITSAWLGVDEQDMQRDGDGYQGFETHSAWLGFNAALDAVVIELPQMIGLNESFQGTPISEIRAQNHYNEAVKKCHAAIESTNLGIKVK